MLDATGHVIAPGFIDIHAHGQTTSDMEIQVRDSVTTALDMEVGVYPVATWYEALDGQSPLNYGAVVSHISARFAVFHPGLEIGHWPVNREQVAALGAAPAGANRAATADQVTAMGVAIRRGLDGGRNRRRNKMLKANATGAGFGEVPPLHL